MQLVRAQINGERHGISFTMSLLHTPLRSGSSVQSWRMQEAFATHATCAQLAPTLARVAHLRSMMWHASPSTQSSSALQVVPVRVCALLVLKASLIVR